MSASHMEFTVAGPASAIACGWLTDKAGLRWQIVAEKIGEILKHPKEDGCNDENGEVDVATLEAAARE
jgi:predicted 3-demethylubiquinone-9 3-methyltransferase (glyoxalase superfamily)